MIMGIVLAKFVLRQNLERKERKGNLSQTTSKKKSTKFDEQLKEFSSFRLQKASIEIG